MVVGGPANLLDAAMVDGTKIDAFIAQRRDTSGLDDPVVDVHGVIFNSQLRPFVNVGKSVPTAPREMARIGTFLPFPSDLSNGS